MRRGPEKAHLNGRQPPLTTSVGLPLFLTFPSFL